MEVKRDDYVFIDVEWKGGFKHIVPCRGYNLKSQIKFNESLSWIKKFTWRVVSKEDYEEKIWGPSLVADTEKTTTKSTSRSRRKNTQEIVEKPLATKQSVKRVTKRTSTRVKSSTATRKQKNGS